MAISGVLKPLSDKHMAVGQTGGGFVSPDGRSFAELWADYDRDGYVIIERVLSADQVEAIRTALTPHLNKRGRNDFEGTRSHRVYSLIEKAPDVFGPLAAHPMVMPFVEKELGRSCLLSAMLAVELLEGETAQDWHYDDEQILVPRPRPAHGVSTFWAIDDTTEENGATQIIPGSHLWDEGDRPEGNHPGMISAAMPSGSLMITKGTLYHRGGNNLTDKPRLIVTPQYCPGWARPLEAMTLSVSKDTARALPKRVRELIGYNIHAAFMGYVDGMHPDRTLGL